MKVEVKVPTVGESISDGLLAQWKKQDGDYVKSGEELFELETDKITMPVRANDSGKLTTMASAGDTVKIGQVVAIIETAAMESPKPKAPGKKPSESAQLEPPATEETPVAVRAKRVTDTRSSFERSESPLPDEPEINPPAGMAQVKANLERPQQVDRFVPSVRRMIEEYRLDPSQIKGTGKGERITKEDVLRHLDRPTPETTEPKLSAMAETSPRQSEEKTLSERQTRVPMTRLRQRIAERLVLAQNSAAILTTFNEVDMTAVMELRQKYQEVFQKKYGIKLGIMSFFVKAAIDALKAVPRINAQIDGTDIVYNHFYDIGVAVSTDKGLVVPVVRDADQLNFAELEKEIAGYAQKARDHTLTLEDLTDGIFTISNGGIFGSLLSTPIVNPPQSGILGMHAIKKRPVAVGDRVEVRPMMYLALSYDHRLVDGAEAVTFLRRVVECIENPERMMLEV